jgi:hypothetical protein
MERAGAAERGLVVVVRFWRYTLRRDPNPCSTYEGTTMISQRGGALSRPPQCHGTGALLVWCDPLADWQGVIAHWVYGMGSLGLSRYQMMKTSLLVRGSGHLYLCKLT